MYDLGDYATMIADPVRGAAYLAAIRETVGPDTVFADIGAGPGVLGIYAALCGARRVFLVEPAGVIDAALELARENGVLDRIQIFRQPSTEVHFPEPASIIASDLRGVLPLYGDHLRAAADMRRRLLRPDGICIPLRDRMHVALIDDAALHAKMVGAWSTLDGTMQHASLTRLLANQWYRTRADGEQLLTEAIPWRTIDYGQPDDADIGDVITTAHRAGTAHGILCWFDTDLTETISFSNSPHAPRALYGQAFFPFERPLPVAASDRVSMSLRAVSTGAEYQWTWSTRVERKSTRIDTAQQASLFGIPLRAEKIARLSESFVPTLSPEAEALRVLIGAVDGSRDLADLAALLHVEQRDRFPTESDALRFVAAHESLWAP